MEIPKDTKVEKVAKNEDPKLMQLRALGGGPIFDDFSIGKGRR